MTKLVLIIFLSLSIQSCVALSKAPLRASQSPANFKPKKLSPEQRALLVKFAQEALGKAHINIKNTFRADCSGVIRGLFAQAKIPLGGIIKLQSDNDVKTIYRYVQKYGLILKSEPQPGDLVFFHNTYDRSNNRRMNDALTHIGIVERIDDNTIYFIHHLGRSIIRSRMNLAYPNLSVDPRSHLRINHVLRRAQYGERAYTAAELWAGFGRL